MKRNTYNDQESQGAFRRHGFVYAMIVSGLLFSSGCTDSMWKVEDELPEELHALYFAVLERGGFGGLTYVYPVDDYERIKLYSEKILESSFKEVTAKEYDQKNHQVRTGTVVFNKRAEHRMKCSLSIDKHVGQASFSAVSGRCEVSSYWTRWNRPPPSLADFVFWKTD